MVVEDDAAIGHALTRWLSDHRIRSVLATTTQEALQIIRDVNFIESRFDALLVDYRLPDATGCRIIQEFSEEFPGTPVALMTGHVDISLELWLKARRIPVFHKPLHMEELKSWLDQLVPAT